MRLTPRGGRDAIEGIEVLSDGSAVVAARVRAAPEDGAANAALRDLLAEASGVARSAVTQTGGAASRIKTFEILGDPAALEARLRAAAHGAR